MRLRVRTPTGNFVISDLSSSSSLKQLQDKIFESTKCPNQRQKILVGYPPTPLSADPEELLSSLSIKEGDTITVEFSTVDLPTISRSTSPPELQEAKPEVKSQTTIQKEQPQEQRQGDEKKKEIKQYEACSEELSMTGTVLRRVVPADGQCLFESIGYLLEKKNERANQLRQIVAKVIRENPDEFPEVVLGRSRQEYLDWIALKDSWGGAIELSILTDYFQVQIIVIDVQTLRIDRYGESKGYQQKIHLLYDGIHYDPLVLVPLESEDIPSPEVIPKEFDLSIFNSSDEIILAKCVCLAEMMKKQRSFTDTSKFTLRCLVCNTGLKGTKEAEEHAAATKHINFAEFH